MLLRDLMAGDSTLATVTHLVIDDVQERNCFLDLLLIALQASVAKFQSLRLVFISTTANIPLFVRLFNNCPFFVGSVYIMFIFIHFV